MTLMPSGAFEIALLRRREFVIDDQDVGMMRLRQFLQFLDFAVSEQRGGVDHGTNLKHLGHNLRAGAGGQFGKLAKGFRRSRGRATRCGVRSRPGWPFPGAAPVKSSDSRSSRSNLAVLRARRRLRQRPGRML